MKHLKQHCPKCNKFLLVWLRFKDDPVIWQCVSCGELYVKRSIERQVSSDD